MSESGIARIFKHAGGQSVHLPSEFHLPGDRCACVASRAASCSSRS